ncbi:hypothetical protein ACFVIZ_06470 [Streptomyces anulatus]|uniref:hypothetical protein n=1 Tax=Streptomyces anulatus TaxID=1892 RepID=UPI00362BAAC7
MNEPTPGQWPVTEPTDLDTAEADEQGRQHLALTKARAARALPMASIRADLEAQPSVACVRAAQRSWQSEITAVADDVVKQLRNAA